MKEAAKLRGITVRQLKKEISEAQVKNFFETILKIYYEKYPIKLILGVHFFMACLCPVSHF